MLADRRALVAIVCVVGSCSRSGDPDGPRRSENGGSEAASGANAVVSEPTESSALEADALAAGESRKLAHPAMADLDSSQIEIVLERSRCLGWCPDYSIVLHGDGTVAYTGRSFVTVIGERQGTISPQGVRELVGLFLQERFFELDSECHVTVMDAPSTTLRLTLGERTREVLNPWVGDPSPNFPEENAHIPVHRALERIADAVDRAVNVEQWIGSDEDREKASRSIWTQRAGGRAPANSADAAGRRPSAQDPEQIAVARFLVEAERLSRSGPASEADALTAFAKAEDETARGLDRAMTSHDETSSSFFATHYRRVLEESDAYVESVFTSERVRSVPWTDLLLDGTKHWQNSALKQWQPEGGTVRIVGPDVGSASNGLVVVPDTGGFRDFEIEVEFTLQGTVDFLFRLGRRVDDTVESWNVRTSGKEPLTAGRTYTLRAQMIGSRLTGELVPGDATFPEGSSTWVKARKGGFGIQVHQGAELTIHNARVRRLRDA